MHSSRLNMLRYVDYMLAIEPIAEVVVAAPARQHRHNFARADYVGLELVQILGCRWLQGHRVASHVNQVNFVGGLEGELTEFCRSHGVSPVIPDIG